MSLPVYDIIGRWYGWNQMPKNDNDPLFFGFSGCNRSNLERVLNLLRNSWGNGWFTADPATRSAFFMELARNTAVNTMADIDGVYKFCFWVFSAAVGDNDVKNWLAGGDFGTLDYYGRIISDTLRDTAEQAVDTIEYGVKYETPAEKTIKSAIPVIGILAACYLAKKILD